MPCWPPYVVIALIIVMLIAAMILWQDRSRRVGSCGYIALATTSPIG